MKIIEINNQYVISINNLCVPLRIYEYLNMNSDKYKDICKSHNVIDYNDYAPIYFNSYKDAEKCINALTPYIIAKKLGR